MSDDTLDVTGGCCCGKVRFTATKVRPTVSECHCTMCRRQSGHRYATTQTNTENLVLEGAGNITWFEGSASAQRGFCTTCGSHLFWRPAEQDHYAILAAAIDEPNDLKMARHIFVADKGGYYEIEDGNPQYAASASAQD